MRVRQHPLVKRRRGAVPAAARGAVVLGKNGADELAGEAGGFNQGAGSEEFHQGKKGQLGKASPRHFFA